MKWQPRHEAHAAKMRNRAAKEALKNRREGFKKLASESIDTVASINAKYRGRPAARKAKLTAYFTELKAAKDGTKQPFEGFPEGGLFD